MDDKFNFNNDDELDITSFDLSQFKEYFEEEDAQREAEEKAEQERLAKESALLAEQAEKELREKQERERILAEQEAAARRAVQQEREQAEARKAAEKAAEAAMAAKRAEESRNEANIAATAKLLEHAQAENIVAPEEGSEKTVDSDEKPIEFKHFSSILDAAAVSNDSTQTSDEDDDFSGFLPDKKKTKSRLLTAVCIILCLAFLSCSAFSVYLFTKEEAPQDQGTVAPVAVKEFKPYDSLQTSIDDTDFPNSINPELKNMYSRNNDLVGWLTINGTAIDYPVVQASNNDYYINKRNAFDETARYGTPFLDFRCNTFELSKNTIVYGHHMNNQMHFGALDGYQEVDFYKQHPIIKYETLNNSYTFKVYAAFYATTQSSSDGGYVFEYYNPNMNTENFKGYINMLKQYALYTTDAGLKETDKIITLSTCTHVYDSLKSGGVDSRLVVVGRLLRSGESESVNTNNVLVNSDYRRPQIWYDSKGKTNPYASSRSWKPFA